MGDELDIRPLLTRLSDDGRVCALPVVVARGEPLVFRRWRPGETLVAAGFGTHEPEPEAPEIAPGIVITPLLAYDDSGRRLGYGGGYYDRTLRSLRRTRRIVAVGVGFDAQRVARVPAGDGDETLDWIVTEERAIRVK
jgi:5-formyltetrahydrofolate cyclo-ligase